MLQVTYGLVLAAFLVLRTVILSLRLSVLPSESVCVCVFGFLSSLTGADTVVDEVDFVLLQLLNLVIAKED